MTTEQLDQLSINTIRTLSMDAVQEAKSGHPGTPMAPLVYTLWNRVMWFDPQNPIWPNRDRFVLSNGHASMLVSVEPGELSGEMAILYGDVRDDHVEAVDPLTVVMIPAEEMRHLMAERDDAALSITKMVGPRRQIRSV